MLLGPVFILYTLHQNLHVMLYRFRCNICNRNIKCDHMGRSDILKHCGTQTHQEQARCLNSQSKLNFASTNSDMRCLEAEVRMALLTAGCNLFLAFRDQLSPLIRSIFPDSEIAKKYHSASTKATCIIDYAVATQLKKKVY